MAKRLADSQITRETFREDSDGEDVDATGSGPKRASDDVMRKRKIAQPRKRKALGDSGNGESALAQGFSFSALNNGKPAAAQPAFSFSAQQQPAATPVAQPASQPVSNDSAAKCKALNLQFREKVIECVSSDPFVDLSSVVDKYKSFRASIQPGDQNGTMEKKPVADAPIQPGEARKDAASDSESDSDSSVKVQGPTFTLTSKPTTKNPVFSFGPKKKRQADSSDSESDVEIKGPQFTISGNVSVSSGPFSLSKLNDKTAPVETASTSAPADTTEKPKLNFGSTATDGKNSTFTFGAPKPENSGPANSSDAKIPTTPAFTFGAAKSSNPTEGSASATTKPTGTGFTFGAPKADSGKQNAPSFSFGSKTAENSAEENKAPSFSFGKSQNSTAMFGSSSTEGQQESSSKPAFSFGASAPQNTGLEKKDASAKPVFSFGTTTPQSVEGEKKAPSFAFGSTTQNSSSTGNDKPNPKAPVEEATSAESKPVFSFSANTAKPSSAPFTFGAPAEKKDSAKPTFTFGTSNAPSAPSFSFGKPAETNDSKSGGFKFSLPFASAASTSEESKTNGNVATGESKEESSKQEDKEETKDETKDDSQPMGMTNGEENETVLFSKRAKLMIINPDTKAYDSRGVGELKLLQNKDDLTKIRILCRSDGMGHILLNTSVVKSFQYVPADPEKENFVKCPVINSEGKLETYIIRVKQKADGRQLCKAIADAQNTI